MTSIFIIDKNKKECIGIIDFIPRKEERFFFNDNEYIVDCILYCPSKNNPQKNIILVFVKLVERYYSNIIKDITWDIEKVKNTRW
jgi:hypothetical protein